MNYQRPTDGVSAGPSSPSSTRRLAVLRDAASVPLPKPTRKTPPDCLVGALLHYAAGFPDCAKPAALSDRGGVDEDQFRHVMRAGLGPLLRRMAQDTGTPLPAAWQETLQAADLSAQLVHGNMSDATVDVVDACRQSGVRVTLLKGISIARHYPAEHLRPMGDVDLLVSQQHGARVRKMLQRRGYVRMSGFHEKEDYHGAPLFQPELRVWVEIHTGLFHDADGLRRNLLFAPSRLERQIVASTFRGRPVGRLGNELQLVYIASYWMRDASNHGLHASFVRPLLDAIYLLAGSELDWDRMLVELDNEIAAASLYALLSFLSTRGLCGVPEPVLARLASAQRRTGKVELRILDRLIERSLLEGRPLLGSFGERHPMIVETLLRALLDRGSPARKLLSLPWALVFPPWIAERYAFRYQRDRLRRLLGRAG